MKKKNSGDLALPKSLQVLLTAMPQKDRKLFGEYLQFEPFNSQRILSELNALIDAYLFAGKKPRLSWEEALAAAGIAPSRIDKLCTLLHQKLDQFLSLQQVLAAPHRHLSYVIEGYTQLNVDYATTEKKWRQISKRLQSEPLSLEHLRSMVDLEHFAITARLESQIGIEGSYFAEMHRLIDQQYLISKLKYCCSAINEAQLLKLPFPSRLAQLVQGLLDSHPDAPPALGQAYRAIFRLQMAEHQPLPHYEALFALLMQLQPEIARVDNMDLFNYLLNLCYRRLDGGEAGFEDFIAKVYGHLMATNLLFDREISSRLYKNIVSLYCRQRQFAQCQSFIEAYRLVLPPEDLVTLPRYCHGLVLFHQGEYDRAAEIFKEAIRADPEDHYVALETRNILLKAYFHRYEALGQVQHDDLYRLVDSFKMYVRRSSKLDTYHQQCYLNFIQYFSMLLRHLEEYGTRDFPIALKSAVEAEKMLPNKAWLLSLF